MLMICNHGCRNVWICNNRGTARGIRQSCNENLAAITGEVLWGIAWINCHFRVGALHTGKDGASPEAICVLGRRRMGNESIGSLTFPLPLRFANLEGGGRRLVAILAAVLA